MWFPGTCEEMASPCSDLWEAILSGPGINATFTVNIDFSQLGAQESSWASRNDVTQDKCSFEVSPFPAVFSEPSDAYDSPGWVLVRAHQLMTWTLAPNGTGLNPSCCTINQNLSFLPLPRFPWLYSEDNYILTPLVVMNSKHVNTRRVFGKIHGTKNPSANIGYCCYYLLLIINDYLLTYTRSLPLKLGTITFWRMLWLLL